MNLNEELGQGKRFVVAPNHLLSDFDKETLRLVILSDFTYWTDHYDELHEWAVHNHAKVSGSTITFSDDKDLISFILKWS